MPEGMEKYIMGTMMKKHFISSDVQEISDT